ncbi:MAG: anthranilate synthase component I [Planctomycetes bacterium]|nr:anthranilate synthase component I [Planctomycetota bacterium]
MHFLHRSTPEDADRSGLAWAEFPADLHTPVRLFLALRGAGHRACLLESAEGPERLARYSFLGVDPIGSFRAAHDGAVFEGQDGREEFDGDGLSALRKLAERYHQPAPPRGLPPFCGGWVGGFTYEWAGVLEPSTGMPRTTLAENPYARFHLFETVVACDHATQKLILITACRAGAAGHEQAMQTLDKLAETLGGEPAELPAFRLLDEEPRPSMSREQYEAGVESLQGAIRQGEIFQAVLAQRFDQRFEGDPFTLYRVLRLANPAPHMFFYEFDDLTLVGSSPERLVSVQDGVAQTRPIAGTRPRHEDPEEDARLGAELCGDLKERAEHDMLVDLGRNDLGRVARVGTVAVKEHAALEKFARVQHLVSRVECKLAGGQDALDALAASFPAGTVSGAPKVRAMTLLAEIEKEPRGAYAGCFGYLDHRGNLDMAINIRTVAVHGDTLSVQAGAGVVYDSVPASEYMETLHKSQALFEAVQLAVTPAFSSPSAS